MAAATALPNEHSDLRFEHGALIFPMPVACYDRLMDSASLPRGSSYNGPRGTLEVDAVPNGRYHDPRTFAVAELLTELRRASRVLTPRRYDRTGRRQRRRPASSGRATLRIPGEAQGDRDGCPPRAGSRCRRGSRHYTAGPGTVRRTPRGLPAARRTGVVGLAAHRRLGSATGRRRHPPCHLWRQMARDGRVRGGTRSPAARLGDPAPRTQRPGPHATRRDTGHPSRTSLRAPVRAVAGPAPLPPAAVEELRLADPVQERRSRPCPPAPRGHQSGDRALDRLGQRFDDHCCGNLHRGGCGRRRARGAAERAHVAKRFGSDAALGGAPMMLDGEPHAVIDVAPERGRPFRAALLMLAATTGLVLVMAWRQCGRSPVGARDFPPAGACDSRGARRRARANRPAASDRESRAERSRRRVRPCAGGGDSACGAGDGAAAGPGWPASLWTHRCRPLRLQRQPRQGWRSARSA